MTSKAAIDAIISEVMAGKRNMPALPERIRQRDAVMASRGQHIPPATTDPLPSTGYDYYQDKGSGGFTGD